MHERVTAQRGSFQRADSHRDFVHLSKATFRESLPVAFRVWDLGLRVKISGVGFGVDLFGKLVNLEHFVRTMHLLFALLGTSAPDHIRFRKSCPECFDSGRGAVF